MDKGKTKSVNPADLPENETFTRKEHFQHPQPQDQGKPLEDGKRDTALRGKEQNRTSKTEGLNESRSPGDAGAFEGFEDQGESD